MADHGETAKPHPEKGGGEAVTPAAALALAGGPLDPRAAAYLEKQNILADEQIALTRLQAEDLRREDRIRHWSLRVRHISDVMKLTFELAAAAILITIAIFIASAIWTAANDNSLVIEAFNVPSDMAARGLTGQVVARRVQDRLAWMQAHTDTIRQASTYASNWADDVKVQIPDTGVSFGEAYRYLAGAVGNQTHISGEVARSPNGITLSTRVGSEAASTFAGTDADLDKLVEQAAEHIYRQTQTYRYVIYLAGQARHKEEQELVRWMARYGANEDRPWAYSRWGLHLASIGDLKGNLEKQSIAHALNRDLPHVADNLSTADANLGHDENELRDLRDWSVALTGPAAKQLAAYAVAISIPFSKMMIATAMGDYREAIAIEPQVQTLTDYSNSRESATLLLATNLARDHDVTASRNVDRDGDAGREAIHLAITGAFEFNMPPLPAMFRAVALDDWSAVRDDLLALEIIPDASSPAVKALLPQLTWPWLAYANVRLGDFAAAHTLINKTPDDCYVCVRMRGNIAAAEKNWAEADRWFAEAVRQAPSLPFAETDWGRALMAKGDLDGAIAKFDAANDKSPHFADPLEYWGEALLAQNQASDAADKFSEANECAPRWGRLHLKWGEALLANGDRDGANAQFAAAATMDLSAAEKSELARVRTPHG